ncbi:hypothetical protein NDU88_007593 [Pleurodeles waltl]|uniref:Uncharacterized protein n=1 Tax=Pleurodeles waltl TaxID=8319 RepID=A0AAV7N7C8_PLEWA|nr:hypothetical protein NDU88_007593 [Pleurodeles waltl]
MRALSEFLRRGARQEAREFLPARVSHRENEDTASSPFVNLDTFKVAAHRLSIHARTVVPKATEKYFKTCVGPHIDTERWLLDKLTLWPTYGEIREKVARINE